MNAVANGSSGVLATAWWRVRRASILVAALAVVVALISSGTPAGAAPAGADAFALPGEPAADRGGAGPADARAGGGGSFASAFFVSRRMSLDGGEPELELLGSAIIWLLLLLSVAGIGYAGTLAAANRREIIMPERLSAGVTDLMRTGRYREAINAAESDGSFYGQVLAAGLREANHGWEAMVHGLEQRAEELVADRQRRIEILNVLGQVSPMMGLFGTVYGMILAFQAIVAAGGAADPVLLAGGIGTALTTTFWGLVVAIPALTGYAIVRSLMDARTAAAVLAAEELIGRFRPSNDGGDGRGAGAEDTPAKSKARTQRKQG